MANIDIYMQYITRKYTSHKNKINLENDMINSDFLRFYFAFGFFAVPPAALPLGFASVVAALLRFRPLFAATGLS